MKTGYIAAAWALALFSAGPAAAQETVVLKFNSPAPAMSPLNGKMFQPWADAVTKASEGTLKVQLYVGGTLGHFGVTYDRVVDGVADIGFIVTSAAGGKFKRQEVAALPFEAGNSLVASTALWKLYEKGVTASEFDAVRPLAIWTWPNASLNSREPVGSMADMKGRKFVVTHAIAGKVIAGLGGAPVTLRPDEAYQAVSRGTADGVLMPFSGLPTFKIHEVTRSHLDAPLGADAAMLFINRKKYDSLPAKAKEALDKHSYLPLVQQMGRFNDGEWAWGRSMVKDRVTALDGQETTRWKAALAPVAQEWAAATPDGARVLAAFREEVKALEASGQK